MFATADHHNHDTAHRVGRHVRRVAVLLVLVCLCAAYAGCPPPDVNESHYLAKAKHYWNPQWCSRDVFLQSAHPHVAFYWAVGWMTVWWPLSTVAYVGRLLAWMAVAWGWQRLLGAITGRSLLAVLAAAWFLVLSDTARMAGEWVVGGVEAKPFAYGMVFGGLAALVAGNYCVCWVWFGAATLFHPLVGGWAMVAATVCWLWDRRHAPAGTRMVPGILAGLLMAAPAVWATRDIVTPNLTFQQAREADKIVVYYRLAHHLAFHTFPHDQMVKFAALSVAALWWGARLGRGDLRCRRLLRFAWACLLIATAGIVIDQSLLAYPDLAAMFLKYYWYRLADALIPAVVAVWIVVTYERLATWHPQAANRYLLVALLLPATLLTISLTLAQRDVRPLADRRFDETVRDQAQAKTKYRNWLRVCQYVRSHTPPDALCWTPFHQQTFKWHADRAEIVCWKDVPQDAKHILEWYSRLQDLYPRYLPGLHITAWSDEEILHKMKKYNAQYIIVESDRMQRPLGNRFRKIYPAVVEENAHFAVYQVIP